MKKSNYFLSGLFMFAVAVLTACSGNGGQSIEANSQNGSGKSLNIAYVLIDTLTSQYKLYTDAADNFQKKQADAEASINEKGKNFVKQMEEFERRVKANLYTQDQFNKEQARLSRLQQEVQDHQARLSNELQDEYQKELQALTDTIQSFMKVYALANGYDFILCKSSGIDNVLYAAECYDVTKDVVEQLNKRYDEENSVLKK
jgi:outer membrane protein